MTKTDFAELKERLFYDEKTGIFYWKMKPRRRIKTGAVAGGVNNRGYLRIKLDNKFYSSHRLAWLYVHGVWPKNFIDHINGDKSDNRICNLREATRRENAQNLKIHRAGKLAGCSYNKKINKWNARMTINKKYINLGFYETEVEAHLAYKNACSSLSETTTRLQKLRDGK